MIIPEITSHALPFCHPIFTHLERSKPNFSAAVAANVFCATKRLARVAKSDFVSVIVKKNKK